ncbi:MAG: hypothetical protein MR031_00350 [Tenericutes bacterium]|nr:hypothetical protein [Mycoplasmatota bacterium]
MKSNNTENNSEIIRATIMYMVYLVPVLLIYLIKGITKDVAVVYIIRIICYPLAFTIITYLIMKIIKQKKEKIKRK